MTGDDTTEGTDAAIASPGRDRTGDSEPGIIRDQTGTQRLIGYVIDTSAGDGTARCWLDMDARHLNRHNRLHGGIAMTLLDTAAGSVAGLSAETGDHVPSLTLSLTASFLAPGLPGRITATARPTGGGQRIKFVEAELRHEDGTLIATASGVFQTVRPKTGDRA